MANRKLENYICKKLKSKLLYREDCHNKRKHIIKRNGESIYEKVGYFIMLKNGRVVYIKNSANNSSKRLPLSFIYHNFCKCVSKNFKHIKDRKLSKTLTSEELKFINKALKFKMNVDRRSRKTK